MSSQNCILAIDYRLYLTNKQVTLKQAFLSVENQATQIASIRVFQELSVDVPQGLSFDDYNAVMVWYERFGYFIIHARLN